MNTVTVGAYKPSILRKLSYCEADKERICLKVIEIKACGGNYACGLSKGHETSNDARLQKHQAACRKHHCHVISW